MDGSLCGIRGGNAVRAPLICAARFASSAFVSSSSKVGILHSTRLSQNPLFFRNSPARRTEYRRVQPVCISTFESITGAKVSGSFYETVRSCSDPSGIFKVLERELSRGAGVEEGGSFNWLAQWYPVGVLKHLDKRQPHGVTVLGRDLVLWWDRSGGEWQVFADVCPHRQAPLSEGRIDEQGRLQCSYHGWAFEPSSGSCTLIPQAPRDKLQVRDSKRACATVYQTKQQQGLLFVYMDPSEGAKARAAANPPPIVPLLNDPGFVHDMAMTDLPYSYDILVENLMDAAHVPFAHHTLLAHRNTGGPIEFRTRKLGKPGIWGVTEGTSDTYIFAPPCLVTAAYITEAPRSPDRGAPWPAKLRALLTSKILGVDGPNMINCIVFFCVPTVPGKSRLFLALPRNFAKALDHWTPGWLKHLTQMTIFDSDAYLLHLQERKIEEGGGREKLDKLYYMPTASDAHVNAFLRWLRKFGGGAPDYGPKAAPRLPPTDVKSRLMDRRWTHVDNCSFCSGALRRFQALEALLHVMPFVLVGLIAASQSKPLRGLNRFGVPLISLAVISAVASRWLAGWIRKHYHFHDYNHALIK